MPRPVYSQLLWATGVPYGVTDHILYTGPAGFQTVLREIDLDVGDNPSLDVVQIMLSAFGSGVVTLIDTSGQDPPVRVMQWTGRLVIPPGVDILCTTAGADLHAVSAGSGYQLTLP